MNELEFTFDEASWRETLEVMMERGSLGAASFLSLMEGEDDDAFEEALELLEERRITPALEDLPPAAPDGPSAERLRLEENLARQEDLTAGLDKEDPLRRYLEEVASLSGAGEDSHDPADRFHRLLPRVTLLARDYVGRGVLLLDLIQEGSLGLWQALLQDSSEEDVRLDWWIRHNMVCAVLLQARQSGVGQRLRQAVEDYRSVDEQLLWELGRNPTVEEIARRMHMSVEETAAVGRAIDEARRLRRSGARQEPEEQPPEEEHQRVEDTAYFQSRMRIGELLSTLPEPDARLLELRFGLEDGRPLTPEQTGLRLGLTGEEVLAREAAALAKLRENG